VTDYVRNANGTSRRNRVATRGVRCRLIDPATCDRIADVDSTAGALRDGAEAPGSLAGRFIFEKFSAPVERRYVITGNGPTEQMWRTRAIINAGE
jgi:hypothetical protein